MRLSPVLAAFAMASIPSLAAMPAAHAASAEITMTNYAFSPASMTVAVGDVVTWTNTDIAPHDVTTTSSPVAIHSSTMQKGQSWSYTFTTPGKYLYICSIHPDMKASITVTAPVQPSRAHQSEVLTTTATRTAIAMAPSTHRVSTNPPVNSRPAATHSSSPAPALPTTSAAGPSGQTLRPLLLVTGLVAAIATLCLLMLAARPDAERND